MSSEGERAGGGGDDDSGDVRPGGGDAAGHGSDGDPRGTEQANVPSRLADLPIKFWVLVVATGIAAGLGAMAFMGLLRLVQHTAFAYHTGEYSPAVARHSDLRRIVVLTAGGFATGAAWWLLRRFGGGTGGEPTKVVWTGAGDVELPQTIIGGAISEVAVAMGGSIGREAAPQQGGAAAGAWLARRFALAPEHRRLLIACGAGAGVGAVYNVPFAGAVFAAEVYLGSLSLLTIVPAMATSLIATAVSWLTLPAQPVYKIPTLGAPPASLVVWALLAGPIIGLAAAMYVRAIGWAHDRRPTGKLLLVLPGAAFAVVGVVAFRYPYVLGNGLDLAQLAMTGSAGLATLAALALLKPALTTLCLSSGASGGLLTPTTSFGAALGASLGQLWALVWPGAIGTEYAVVGAAAMLSAAMQAPLTSIAFVLELTGHAEGVMVPILLAAATATITCRHFETRSIYSARIPLRG
ncbi:MAG: chloride channel protein [Acidimicrobiales bacterium]